MLTLNELSPSCLPLTCTTFLTIGGGLHAIATHRHRTPDPDAVFRGVVVDPLAGLVAARLEARPAPLGQRGKDDGEQAAQRPVQAGCARFEGGRSRGREAKRQLRAPGCGIEHLSYSS